MVTGAFDNGAGERLLKALAEQLKLPLLHIAREAELGANRQDIEALQSIGYTADMALSLVDSYLLSLQIQSLPTLELEPVSVSAMLQDTAHQLDTLAKRYNCELEVNLGGKYGPVMAHRQGIEAAYITLAHAFIEAAPAEDQKHTVVLGAHRSQRGLVTGIYGEQAGLTADSYRRGKALLGSARQNLPGVSPAAGAGIFVADALLSHMAAPLHLSRHHKQAGLAATLLPSQQLVLV